MRPICPIAPKTAADRIDPTADVTTSNSPLPIITRKNTTEKKENTNQKLGILFTASPVAYIALTCLLPFFFFFFLFAMMSFLAGQVCGLASRLKWVSGAGRDQASR